MTLPFTKMHGLGNDFVVIDARSETVRLSEAQISAIANRRTGVGCDQFIIIEPPPGKAGAPPEATAFMRIHNPDGSEAGACGNATRCVAHLLMAETGRRAVVIETVAGLLRAHAADRGLVTVDMGPARLDWRDIPLAEPTDTLHLPIDLDPLRDPGLGDGALRDPVAVSMGNPHLVFFVPDIDAVPLDRVGPVLEHHALFPQRTNVEIVQVLSPARVRMRVWERSAGITQACGSGACAVLVAAARRGLTGRRADVVLDGGTLGIEWLENGHVLMTGPVATSFTGTLAGALLDAGGTA